MNRTWIAGGIAVIAVFAAVFFIARDPDAPVPTPMPAASVPRGESPAPPSAATGELPPRAALVRPVPPDPRLAALMVSPDNGLVELVPGADGRVIKEIDKDPNSPRFSKPLREYTWAGDKIVGVTTYRHHGTQTEIVTARVSYKSDGGVDRIEQSSNFEPAR
jgi:hypothetical protein